MPSIKKVIFTLLATTLTFMLHAQADYYINMTAPNQQFRNALWKNSDGTPAFAIYTTKRDFLEERKEVRIFQDSQEKYTLQRKKTNRVLRDSESGEILVSRPFKYVLPNGQVLTRRIRNWGRALHLEDRSGNLVASAETVKHPEVRRRLELTIHQATGHDEILAAMLSMDMLDQDRANHNFAPILLCF